MVRLPRHLPSLQGVTNGEEQGLSTNHKITHTHEHAHRHPHPDAYGHTTLQIHSHEHDHTSYAESYRTERMPIHRKHYHSKENS